MRRFGLAALLGMLAVAGCGKSAPPPTTPGLLTPSAGLGSLAASGAGHRFFEVYEPDGPARGTMIAFHGGGWEAAPGDARSGVLGGALAYRAQGWRVVDADYSSARNPGKPPNPLPMIADVVAFYEQVRRAFPGPVCATGPSAGGHLSAMLAVLRPKLTCAVVDAGPLDLVSLVDRNATSAQFVTGAFGTDPRTLAAWSPARLWKKSRRRPPIFVTVADGDGYVPASQGRAFERADPHAVVKTLPAAVAGAADAAPFIHSYVKGGPRAAAVASELAWENRIVPPAKHYPAPPAPSATRSCDAVLPHADWRTARRRDRWRLLRAGLGWKATQTPNGLLAATTGCSGSGRSQDDGLSVWAPPASGQRARTGTSAALTFTRGRPLRSITVSLRGYLARPRDWDVGLYAGSTPVAACTAGRCRGLRLAGSLIASPGSGDPDSVDEPPSQRIALPSGTRQVSIKLTCASPSGCSLGGISRKARPRDPVGHPAILSIYAAVAR
jgi:dienelactone hydrolase